MPPPQPFLLGKNAVQGQKIKTAGRAGAAVFILYGKGVVPYAPGRFGYRKGPFFKIAGDKGRKLGRGFLYGPEIQFRE
jgi:hypothetical protein